RPVVGELRNACPRLRPQELLECLPDAAMKAGAPGTTEVVVERVIDQRVGEREAARDGRGLNEHGSRHCFFEQLEQLEQLVLGAFADMEEKLCVEVATDHRSGGERLARLIAEPPDAAPDDFP